MSLRSSETISPVFGSGQMLPKNVLPTYFDMMKYYIHVSQSSEKKYQDLVKDTSETVATEIENIWKRASLPIVEHRTIVARIKTYHNKHRGLLKSFQRSKNSESFKNKLQKFKAESLVLFDIATCKCTSFDKCSCDKSRKIPMQERDFLMDQRSDRKLMIGSLDRKSTKKNIASFERKLKRKVSEENNQERLPEKKSRKYVQSDVNAIVSAVPSTSKIITPTQNEFSVVARTLDRYGISDRAGAAIVSATLQDIGLVTQNTMENVIDRNKIRRSRAKKRNTAILNVLDCDDSLICVSFDGRKDKTLVNEDNRRKIVLEEHISLVKEPGSQYIGHIAVKKGDAKTISSKLYFYLSVKCNLNRIIAIGCDGTAVNTGNKSGIISLLERKLQRPLQWLVCQLHANELPLRHLFEHLDGTTTGPRSFTGVIGKALKDCECLPVINFCVITCNLPDITKSRSDLSTDQLYLFEICSAINNGFCDDNLAKRNPGKIVHSRWLTTANRILRLYVSTKDPSPNFVILTEFVLKVYAPMWFTIKTQPHCVYGAKHLFKTIELSRYLPDHLKKILDSVIQRNGYFGHCENILISMLADERNHIKELALRRILKIREQTSGLAPIRVFKLPKFNFDAADYFDLIDWNQVSEPPLLKQIENNLILEATTNPDLVESIILPKFCNMPCHTQATERCIKLVTESCSAVCGPERREGLIRNKLESCRIMPLFNSKKDYKIN